jgi:catechol 2,3-dioxygenase-like lactoylglutathione lyase family enzyme
MINAVHALIYAKDADRVRAFFRDVLGFPSVDAGGGWLIFALPPAELGIHPHEGERECELYLMCDDVQATVAGLKAKGVEFTRPIHFGIRSRPARRDQGIQASALAPACRAPGRPDRGGCRLESPERIGR